MTERIMYSKRHAEYNKQQNAQRMIKNVGHMNIRGPQLFYSFFHTLEESSSYWCTILRTGVVLRSFCFQ